MFKIRNAKMDDLQDVVDIENLCFIKTEAATKEAFIKRIQYTPDSFFVAEDENGKIVGIVNGPVIENEFITDDLFSKSKENPKSGGHQSVLGLAVTPQYQKRGISSMLLTHLENEAKAKNRKTVTLTCKENFVPFYEKMGYMNRGLSESGHGGVTWYNMTKKL
ncbi:acetyltransferase [Schinkia azotoformans MEV2011]|uniref:Acetyltransferase n=1 Tax=Schinkia azotoformans MEV2011 TaxID=1348973 RepID=A0A072NKY5_SCHAZ|nr:GNAT family N-acetyltransferase [Schinkia azotoformans]KEF37932.1 acetyltransferase [Schinkia azotoformans MEV2011]MEC1696291.1 GNAT family N-acetyltransferase [Schinkia azotoformans]MEC1726796.1 GNAT family N-acetyltransferase [Schinkia azotoformans]MEC1770827.1 GNAT family N-acetyltransferase [Schinkia azotoformans]MEC1780809.1 GNAT family N-acetyltransferase [Schinkia azotoformans]